MRRVPQSVTVAGAVGIAAAASTEARLSVHLHHECIGNAGTTINVAAGASSIGSGGAAAEDPNQNVLRQLPPDASGGAGGSDQSWQQGCDLPDTSALFTTIAESNLIPESKQLLCECFANLNADWSEGLSELFMTGTAEETAHVLEEVARCCVMYYPYSFDSDYAHTQPALLQGGYCPYPVPVYKGVALPK